VYVAGAIRAPEGQIRSVGGIGPFIRDSYSRFDHPVLELIDHISEEQYIVDDLYDRDPPKSLHRGHVVVIGDAAHPMTPDLGQGACQAIEDGVLLASCMSHEVEVSLLRFERLRLRRVARIVRESRRLGDICTSTNRTFAVVRNAVLRLSPSALTVRHLAAFNSRDAFEAQLKSE
jgi:2-polyprenyl-6-methoxyphenol hydroxylase-like FAD-dependent oxidoreductase